MTPAARTIRLYPWHRFAGGLLFWQALWFLYLQAELSASAAIALWILYDVSTLVLEVPSGILSDRIGRRRTLIAAAGAFLAGALLMMAGGFWALAAGQVLFGAAAAFASGSDSAILYESLAQEGRAGEVEAQEVRAWRFHFAALAASAVLGGALGLVDLRLAYGATALAGAASLLLAYAMAEPARAAPLAGTPLVDWSGLRQALASPVLGWLLALSVAAYLWGHLPFVFGQPFIANALAGIGLEATAPLVSGGVTAAMMLASLLASALAPAVRHRLGLARMLLAAFAVQVALVAALAVSDAAWIIPLLFLRMVPSALIGPFLRARAQPLLIDSARATYLSLQSFAGRIVFAAALILASTVPGGGDALSHPEIARILWPAAALGVLTWLGLAATARRAGVDPRVVNARERP